MGDVPKSLMEKRKDGEKSGDGGMEKYKTFLIYIYTIQQCWPSHHAIIYYIPSIYLSYNWNLVPFDHFPPSLPPLTPGNQPQT